MTSKEKLRNKIIDFQRRIVTLEGQMQDKARQACIAEDKLLLEVIDILDVLENLGNLPICPVSIRKTIERIERKLLRVLEGRSIVQIEFPDGLAKVGLSKIVETEVRPELVPGTILHIVRRGYRRAEQIVRPAELITSKV